MFKKILIANRGEIAVRVMRTCREMEIPAVAVYSDCDRTALHVTYADEAIHIGPSPSAESYLNIERIIEAARQTGAEAIHPGYGFLAENATFAQACADAGIKFIGPPVGAINTMGDKLAARDAMKDSGVPIIPGSDGPVTSAEEAVEIAEQIGVPVMIKAVAGGGGKGMRVVHDKGEVAAAVSVTMGEAKSGFGDERVFVEKYITNPKHIEVQVMADQHGNAVALGERECSMQRRYQKVIEEAPSPSVDADLRAKLCEAGRKAAMAVDYEGAGTIEFVMGDDKKFYFLEMNTRLQVEHPVTELVYGVDLVREQIRVAAGLELSIEHGLEPRGHAIETRIYAENPYLNFMPSTGTVKRLSLPEGPGVRNDNGIYAGFEIPIYYDPMIGKVCAWASDRETAIGRLRRALEEYRIDGVTTNIEFLEWALDQPGFIDGSYDTTFIDKHFEAGLLHVDENEIELATIAASIAAYRRLSKVYAPRTETARRENVWRRAALIEGLRKPRLKP